VNGLGDKSFHVMWFGTKYALTPDLDMIAGYYHYIQESYFGTATGGRAHCSGAQHAQCAGTFDAISAGLMRPVRGRHFFRLKGCFSAC
jgi:hypothetical protein